MGERESIRQEASAGGAAAAVPGVCARMPVGTLPYLLVVGARRCNTVLGMTRSADRFDPRDKMVWKAM
jgi:hypothetical protein